MPRAAPDPTLQLADALDGMAGAIRKGKKVPKADLEAAGKAAHHLWPRHRPEEAAAAVRFETARSTLMVSAAGAASGKDPDATFNAEDAARRLASDLRLFATRSVPETHELKEPRARPGEVAARLKRRYARLGKAK